MVFLNMQSMLLHGCVSKTCLSVFMLTIFVDKNMPCTYPEVHLPPAPVTLEAIVRCRPLLSHESGFTEGVNTSLPFELRAEHRQIIAGGNEFALDGVMGPDATQENVYVCLNFSTLCFNGVSWLVPFFILASATLCWSTPIVKRLIFNSFVGFSFMFGRRLCVQLLHRL